MQAPCSGFTLPWCRNAVAYIWYGIAVLPCFSTSGKVPVTRCGLPLRGTYAANVPAMVRIVERRGGGCVTICQALRRGSCVALLSDLPSLLFPRRQVDLSRFLRLTFTVGCDPVFWCRRQDLNLRIPPGAVLYRLSYVCISPASAGVRRKERMDGKNEDTDITPHPHSDTYFYLLAPNWGQRPIFFAIL